MVCDYKLVVKPPHELFTAKQVAKNVRQIATLIKPLDIERKLFAGFGDLSLQPFFLHQYTSDKEIETELKPSLEKP